MAHEDEYKLPQFVGEDVRQLDLYDILGVSIMATDEELRQSWKKLALKHHPDRHAGDPDSTVRFQAIQHAYDILKDRTSRSEYDKALLHRLYVQEYLGRFADLILTSSGLGLPLEEKQQQQDGNSEYSFGACRKCLTETMHRSSSVGSM